MKKVSIVTPCYNGENHINRLIESILSQTYKNIEFIIINDGSIDNTENIILDYKSKFKKANIDFIYKYKDNGGQASALNLGLKLVTGDYLIWPDADDYFETDAIEKMVVELDKNNEISYVKGNPIYREELSLKIIDRPKPINKNKSNYFMDYLFVTPNVCCFVGIIMIKFDDFKKVNKGLDIYEGKAGQNWQMILPITYSLKGKYIDEDIYNYLVREDSHSHSINDKKKKINRTYELYDVLEHVLDKIDMPEEERLDYKTKLKEKYKLERIEIKKDYSIIFKIYRRLIRWIKY